MPFFRRMKVKTPAGKTYTYVRLVENVREGEQSTQRVLLDLGNELELPDLISKLALCIGADRLLAWIAPRPELRALFLAWPKLTDDARDHVADVIRAAVEARE